MRSRLEGQERAGTHRRIIMILHVPFCKESSSLTIILVVRESNTVVSIAGSTRKIAKMEKRFISHRYLTTEGIKR